MLEMMMPMRMTGNDHEYFSDNRLAGHFGLFLVLDWDVVISLCLLCCITVLMGLFIEPMHDFSG